MSVTTTADEHIATAKEQIEKAINLLSTIDTEWGWNEFGCDYQLTIKEVALELFKVKTKL